jgi:hypothetical protein
MMRERLFVLMPAKKMVVPFAKPFNLIELDIYSNC